MIQLQGAGKRFGHKLLFEDCNWLITPRERTGLVGGNGTGKSTLLKIIHGAESLDYGNISYTKGTTLGYLPQDVELFSGTVAENICRFGKIEEAEVVAAARMAGVHTMIQGLPEGYGTQIGEGGQILCPPRSRQLRGRHHLDVEAGGDDDSVHQIRQGVAKAASKESDLIGQLGTSVQGSRVVPEISRIFNRIQQ